jgi:hypothetical protein
MEFERGPGPGTRPRRFAEGSIPGLAHDPRRTAAAGPAIAGCPAETIERPQHTVAGAAVSVSKLTMPKELSAAPGVADRSGGAV